MLLNFKQAGTIGIAGSVTFFITFVLLGFFQSDYNHLRDTVSMLVLGKYGFIQNINFILLAFTLMSVGYRLGMNIHRTYVNPITFSLGIFGLGFIVAAIFPTHYLTASNVYQAELTMPAQIHFWGTLGIIFFSPLIYFCLIPSMKSSEHWQKYVFYTQIVIFTSFIFGCLWFYLLDKTFFFELKGLYQKILICNVLLWVFIVSNHLKRFKGNYDQTT